MAIIKITQDSINRMHQPDAGWHLFVVRGMEEKASKNKDSVNYNFDLEVVKSAVSPENESRHLTLGSNSKAVGIVMIPFVAAINGVKIDEVQPCDIDTDKLIGKKLWAEVKDDIYDGKPTKKFTNNFCPENDGPSF